MNVRLHIVLQLLLYFCICVVVLYKHLWYVHLLSNVTLMSYWWCNHLGDSTYTAQLRPIITWQTWVMKLASRLTKWLCFHYQLKCTNLSLWCAVPSLMDSNKSHLVSWNEFPGDRILIQLEPHSCLWCVHQGNPPWTCSFPVTCFVSRATLNTLVVSPLPWDKTASVV
jgi:hypothetical protein